MTGPDAPGLVGWARRRLVAAAAVLWAALACGDATSMACAFDGTPERLAERPSPPDSVMLIEEGLLAKLCYSRPSARGRVVFGGLEPWDTLWRTGANEPTVLHLSVPAEIAGLRVEPGDYSIYTVPGRRQWTVVVNASTSQWGLTRDAVGVNGRQFQNAYTDEVRAQEVGRAPVEVDTVPHVETLTARFVRRDGASWDLAFEWETTRIRIPLRLLPDP